MVGDANDAEVPKICRFIICSRAACWEEMWKKTLSLFAVDAIGKSISVPGLLRGRSEEWNERRDAHRVCFPCLRRTHKRKVLAALSISCW
jgi:hypothetical protein